MLERRWEDYVRGGNDGIDGRGGGRKKIAHRVAFSRVGFAFVGYCVTAGMGKCDPLVWVWALEVKEASLLTHYSLCGSWRQDCTGEGPLSQRQWLEVVRGALWGSL